MRWDQLISNKHRECHKSSTRTNNILNRLQRPTHNVSQRLAQQLTHSLTHSTWQSVYLVTAISHEPLILISWRRRLSALVTMMWMWSNHVTLTDSSSSSRQYMNSASIIYTHCQSKKLGHFYFSVTMANVGRFLKFFQCRNQKEMAHNKNEKFPTVA